MSTLHQIDYVDILGRLIKDCVTRNALLAPNGLEPDGMISEFRTIVLNGPRQSGKTSALMSLVTSNSVVLHSSAPHRDQFIQLLQTRSQRHSQVISAAKQRSHVWSTMQSIANPTLQEHLLTARLVFCDDLEYTRDWNRRRFIRAVTPYLPNLQCLVFVGT